MSAAGALDLRDIHLPAEPSWWPPAPGWWLLAALALLLLFVLCRHVLHAVRRRRRVRAIDREMNRVMSEFPAPDVARLAALSELIRKFCKRYAPDKLTASGDDVLAFLDRGSDRPEFSEGVGRLLLCGPFQPTADPDAVDALTELLRYRLRQLAASADA